ncbi:MAG: 2-hydroxyacyl-CoA dehydratase family protein [Promethearchaeota archaeon]|jgi:benzoyl-CoA reductase/2-hydroxyglutaryl-CoA dehydratase subunit BcrC/BadD/HgdB
MQKIGIFDSGVETPEEIVMAAGFTPYRFFGDPTLQPDRANEHIPPTHCIWTRNLLEQAIKGLNENIVGIIGTHGCDRTNREFDIWIECLNLSFMFFLNSPRKRDNLAPGKLKDAIIKMNKIRKLLKQISDYRNNLVLKGSEFHELVKNAQYQDKNQVLENLEKKLEELKSTASFPVKNIKRILLTGSEIDDTEFIKYLEDLGFHIVIDDLGVGTKYFWNLVDENLEPIEALAKYHLTKPINSIKYPSYERFNVLEKLAKDYKVDGVINIAQKFCEPVLYDHPYLNKKFKELEIPYLFIEVTYNREVYNQLSTRFSAFAEII